MLSRLYHKLWRNEKRRGGKGRTKCKVGKINIGAEGKVTTHGGFVGRWKAYNT